MFVKMNKLINLSMSVTAILRQLSSEDAHPEKIMPGRDFNGTLTVETNKCI